MKISFTKMSGAGNDFVVVDNRAGIISNPYSFTIKVCDRRLGIGADGVLLVENTNNADFEMKYYNADGSNAGMCGNGGRCISKFTYDSNIVLNEQFKFEAFGHIYDAYRLENDLYELKMKEPINIISEQTIKIDQTSIVSNYINTGTDHAVIFLTDNPDLGKLEVAEVFRIGKIIRYHDIYKPIGTNVNFVSKIDSKSIQIRTYERGVEDETLACGTGSVASALLSSLKFGISSPINVKVQSGENLEVSFEKFENKFSNVRLKGSAKVTFNGEIDI